jgi:hypothetical protein
LGFSSEGFSALTFLGLSAATTGATAATGATTAATLAPATGAVTEAETGASAFLETRLGAEVVAVAAVEEEFLLIVLVPVKLFDIIKRVLVLYIRYCRLLSTFL